MPGRDIKQVNAVAALYGMTLEERADFKIEIEWRKRHAERGEANWKGDFTFQQLCQIAEELGFRRQA